MTKKAEIAVEKFNSGYNCAQSVIYALSEDAGINKNTALKVACGFGGGMGRKQEVCGAVTGGIIAIGAKYGRGENEDQSASEKTYFKTRELIDKFQAHHGSITCLELLDGCNLMTEKGQKYFRDNNLKNNICNQCVITTINILNEIL